MKDDSMTSKHFINKLVELRQQADEALKQSERQLRSVADFTQDWEDWIEPGGKYVYVSPSCERITGYRPDEFIRNSSLLESIAHADDRVSLARHAAEELESRDVLSIDFRIITRSNEERWIAHICQPIFDLDGRWLGRRANNWDVTDRKRVEEALKQRNYEMALLNRAGQALISALELDQVLATVLEEVRDLLGVVACMIWLVDTATDELVCRQVSEITKKEILHGWRLASGEGLAGWVIQSGNSLNVPDARADKRYAKEGAKLSALNIKSILSIPLTVKRNIIGVLQVMDDTVDRFSTEDQMLLESLATTAVIAIENARLYEQALKDAETKSVLLHEVNHRVKNNLSAIIGLLYAERRHSEVKQDTLYQAIMNDLINRVQGLAIAHDLLSNSEWRPLILSELTEKIIHASLQALPVNKNISVNVSKSPVRVPPIQASNLAMVINEIATNTVKYALQERVSGKVSVNIGQDEDEVTFEFRDDGPGYPEEALRLERHKVGLYLLKTIVANDLKGELALHNDQGAVTTIRFKVIQQKI